MAAPIQMDIKVEEEQILCQYYQQNINCSNIQLEKTKRQRTKDGAKDFESINALSTNYCDIENDGYDDHDYDYDEEHECTLCAKLFQSEKLFKAHIKEHAKLDGLLSDSGEEEEFQTIEELETKNSDNQSIASEKEKSVHIHTNAKGSPHNCPKNYANKRQLQIHLNRHNGPPYKCEICSKSFPYRSRFESHVRTHTGERPYECDICLKTFKCTGDLTRHKLVHNGERPFTCETCSKSFQRRSALKKHMFSHTGNHPYKCEICSKKYADLNSLKMHKETHSGEHPFTCEICSESFYTCYHLNVHMNVHIEELSYKCEICSKTFQCTNAITNHMRIHTGEHP